MMYPYIVLADGTEVTHSGIIEKDGVRMVEVQFYRSAGTDICSAKYALPSCRQELSKGFSGEEMAFFYEFLHHNAYLLYRYAERGGIFPDKSFD